MTTRAKNFRRRPGDDDADGDDTPSTMTSTATSASTSTSKPSSKTISSKQKKQPQQAPKLLSFADEEQDDSFSAKSRVVSSKASSKPSSRVSKLSSSHKITAVKDRLAPSSASLPSNVQPQAGTYTTETLLELKKNSRTLASSRPPPSEPQIKLKGPIKPISNNITETLDKVDELSELEEEEEEEEEETGRGIGSFRRDKDDAENRLASMGIGKNKDSSGSLIPDQATINAIRAKRERLRQSRAAAPDYIALDGGSNHGEAEGLSDDEPEFQGRISLLGDQKDNVKKGVFESVDERVSDGVFARNGNLEVIEDDEDEEEKIWEEEQFRKGLGKRMDDGSTMVGSNICVVQSVPNQNLLYPAGPAYTSAVQPSVSAGLSIGGAVGSSYQGLDVMPVSQQAEIARKALQDNMRRLKESHGRTMSTLARTDENLSASLLNITALENSLSAASEKFIFMQELRDFVSVICDFLQHKAPFIEELEEQMQKLHEERASAVIERRASDNDDEMVEVEASVNAAMSVFNKGGPTSSTVAAAATAAQNASAAVREQTNLPVKLDEFGRDINLKKRMDIERRAEARKRRKSRSDSRRLSSMEVDTLSQRVEGESSTDESDTESIAYKSNRDLLLQTADQIFSDAAEEFSQLSVVKERLEKLKRNYYLTYRDAYMSLSVPAIFSPYVRLELLKWDPLNEDADFNDMKWHSLLFNYGMPEDGSDLNPDDADINLVPELVEKVALPILHHEIAHCWDMLSTRETKNAVSATNLVINYVPASSEALSELLAVVRTRLEDAVTSLMVPTWSPLVLKAVPNAARLAAYQFGMSVRLMRNICLWKDILALPVLEKLALDELLSGKVLPHVRSITSNIHDAITRTERIVASLSGVWAGQSVTAERSRRLQPLVEYVLILGKTLEKKHGSGLSESSTSGLARRLKKMLVELNEYDKARAISRTFQLKEAI